MSLERKLREANYELIDNPIRNKRELQLWVNKLMDKPTLYCEHINDIFRNSMELTPLHSPGLSINSSDVKTHQFTTGISLVKNVLDKMNLGKGDIDSIIKTGRSVQISYDKSEVPEYPKYMLEKYIIESEFDRNNHLLKEDLNRDNILLISGMVYAKNFSAKIETNFDITTTIEADLKQILNSKVEVGVTDKNILMIKAEDEERIPIAVQIFKLRFKRGEFKGMRLITDKLNLLDRVSIF